MFPNIIRCDTMFTAEQLRASAVNDRAGSAAVRTSIHSHSSSLVVLTMRHTRFLVSSESGLCICAALIQFHSFTAHIVLCHLPSLELFPLLASGAAFTAPIGAIFFARLFAGDLTLAVIDIIHRHHLS